MSKVQLNETNMVNLLANSVKNVLREAFENDDLRKLASEHGGIDKARTEFLTGGRDEGAIFPYDKARVERFIPSEGINAYMRYFFPLLKLNASFSSIIVFKDGSGAIVETGWQETRQAKKKDMLRNKNHMLDDALGRKDKASYRGLDQISDKDEFFHNDTFTAGRGIKHKEANPKHNNSDL